MAFPIELVEKYPSLRKMEELGDDYEEASDLDPWNDGREAKLLAYIKQRSDFSQLQNNPAKILEAMDTFAAEEDFLISIGSDKARIMQDLLAEESPSVVVELGGYLGYSAIMFGDYLQNQRNVKRPRAHVWSLEFEPDFAAIMREIIAIAGLSDIVTFVTGPANESLRELKSSGEVEKVDFLFMDHVEDLYEQDLKVCEELGLLKSGACIVADNVVRPGAPAYRTYVRSHAGLRSSGVKGLIVPGDFEDEIEVSKVL
ncbi:hypothetical protein LTR36_008415 [Oleoguttula mirabilis]|uniref:catechol O-methyltransferase n=1 Tax=Oleoguttula mirabilis TaxID=1507867 RepID=A0AAV9J7L6_9PEZI|nr:hypothetical protein LTR36_008415 [Oleoguttula mirabilis]